MIAPDLAHLARPIASLREDPRNARRHGKANLAAIAASLDRFSQVKPIVALDDGTVIAGNGTLVAARDELGWDQLAVVTFEDEERARAFALADNQTALLASWDAEELAASLAEIAEQDLELLAATGFSDRAIEQMLRPLGDVIEDDVPDLPDEPRSRVGDLWRLGTHLLAVGDCTARDVVERLMAGTRAACMWSDPPYGVRYTGGTKAALTLTGDTPEGLDVLLRGAFTVADEVLEPGAPFYICHPAGPLALTFQQVVTEIGWRVHQGIVWVKDSLVLGHSDYHFRHEPILFGWTAGPGRSGRGNHEGSRWFGDDAQDTVFDIPRPKRSADHPTSKPVELVARCLRNSTKTGDAVYEPFCGSGSTLIACEQLGRVCRAVEIDPRYADVTVARWEALTGEIAERVEVTS